MTVLKCSAWELPDFLRGAPWWNNSCSFFCKYFLSASFIPWVICWPQRVTNRHPASNVLKKASLFVWELLACFCLLTSLLNLPELVSLLLLSFGFKFHLSKVSFSFWSSPFLYYSLLGFGVQLKSWARWCKFTPSLQQEISQHFLYNPKTFCLLICFLRGFSNYFSYS